MRSRARVRKIAIGVVVIITILDYLKWSIFLGGLQFDMTVYTLILLSPAILLVPTKNPYRSIGASITAALFLCWQIYYLAFVEPIGSGSGNAIAVGIIPLLYGIPLSIIFGFAAGSLMKGKLNEGTT